MKLRARLVVLFLVVALVPLALVFFLLMDWTTAQFETQFEQRASAVSQAVENRFGQASREVAGQVEQVAANGALYELKTHVKNQPGAVPPHVQQAVDRTLADNIASARLDTLAVVTLQPRLEVISSAHQDGALVADDMAVQRAQADEKRPFFRYERIENQEKGQLESFWTLQTQRNLSPSLIVVGGQKIDSMVQGLLVGLGTSGVHIAFEIDGKRIQATFDGPGTPPGEDGFEERTIPISAVSNTGATGTIRLYMSRTEVVKARASLLNRGLMLGGLAVLLALVLGVWLSGRLSSPLEELAGAATQVASGRRDLIVRERRGRDELSDLIRAFNVMTDTLEESETRLKQSERIAAWREIAKRIAHEIKNPLTPIQLNIELLQRSYRREPDRYDEHMGEVLSTTLKEVARVGRIVNEFSNFARMPAPVRRPTCLGEMVSSTLVLHAEASGETVLETTGLSELEASIDPDQIRQVLTNLVKNAIEAVAENGERESKGLVQVDLAKNTMPDGSRLALLSVSDNGPGMPSETRDKLFTPYFTTKVGGTGLGLAIVHRIVVEHGGSIEVLPNEPQGTRFTVRLPV